MSQNAWALSVDNVRLLFVSNSNSRGFIDASFFSSMISHGLQYVRWCFTLQGEKIRAMKKSGKKNKDPEVVAEVQKLLALKKVITLSLMYVF